MRPYDILNNVETIFEPLKAIKRTNKLAKIDIIFFKLAKISKIFVEKRILVQLYRHLV